MSDIKYAKNGIVFGLLNNIINIILPFVSRTIIIYKLGTDYVGLGSLFTSILQVLSLSELGIGAAISYILYEPILKKDVNKINAILRFYKIIYLTIGVSILILSVCLLPFLKYLITGDIPNGINIISLYLIYVLNTVESYFFGGYKKVLLSSNKRYDIEVKINSMAIILQYIIQIILLILFSNYYLYVTIFPIITLVNNGVSYLIVKKLWPHYRCKGNLKREEIREIMKITFGSFFSKIGSTVYLTADNIVISAFLGLYILGIYNNYYYILSALISIFAVINNTLRPIIGQSIIKESSAKIWGKFNILNSAYMGLIIFCGSCCLSLFQDFELLWCGKDNMLSFPLVILLVVYFFTGRNYCVLLLYQEAAGLMWKGKFVPLLSAVFNLIINIILVRFIGLYGILLSSILSSVFISFPGYMYIIFGSLFDKRNKYKYIGNSVVDGLKMLIVSGLTYVFSYNLMVVSWVGFIFKMVFVCFMSVLLIFIVNIKNRYFKQGIKIALNMLKK